MNGDGKTDYQIGSPEETLDPVGYVDIMQQSVGSMELSKQMENYLIVKLRVTRELIIESNSQAVKAQLELVKIHLSKETDKAISGQNAFVLLAMISNLEKLMIK
jgi:hypothetical protein